MKNSNVTNSNPFPYEVKVNLHMFRALMLNRVGIKVNCTDIVAINQSRLGKRIVELLEKLSKPGGLSNSIGDSPILSLCTAALERETVVWRLDDQEIKLPPKKTAYPEVDLRVSGHPAQSASV